MTFKTNPIHQEVLVEKYIPVVIDNIDIDPDDLAQSLIDECDDWEIEELILKLDELKADWNFTQKMFNYFKAELDRKHGANPDIPEEVLI